MTVIQNTLKENPQFKKFAWLV